MAIVKMKKLRLMAVRSEREELLRELMLLGCVEISEPDAVLADEEISPLVTRESSELLSYRKDYTELLNGVKVLDKFVPWKKKLLDPLPEVSQAELLDDAKLESSLELAGRLIKLDDQVRNISSEESRLRNGIEALRPWEHMDMKLDSGGTERCAAVLGTVPGALELGEVQAALEEALPESQLIEIAADKDQHYLLLICFREAQQEAIEALRAFSFSISSLGKLSGTPQDNINMCEKKLAELAESKAELIEQISAQAVHRQELKLCSDRMNIKSSRAEATERLVGTDSAVVLTGWIPAPEEENLAAIFEKFNCAWETEEPDPETPEEVPIKIKNNKLTEPYGVVTSMYSLPAYNGMDANPFVMPAFALFFGIMFADMGYGLLMIAVGLIMRRSRPRGGMKNMMNLAIQCGITTFIIGFLTGGFFGDAVSVVGGIFGQEWNLVPYLGTIRIGDSIAIDLPLNLLEGNNPLYVLVLAMILGVIHLAVGVGIGVYLKVKDGQWLDAVLNDISWWVMFVGIALMILGYGNIVLYVGIAMMLVGAVMGGKGLGRITGVFGAVYNGVTGYLGDILSYSRLMALMLAGSVIGSVFNQLGSLGGIFMFIPVFLIGHALNFALNIIGCFVHTMRLQFLEFFGKWYREGGRAFKPLAIYTKYVDIIKEDN